MLARLLLAAVGACLLMRFPAARFIAILAGAVSLIRIGYFIVLFLFTIPIGFIKNPLLYLLEVIAPEIISLLLSALVLLVGLVSSPKRETSRDNAP